MEGLSGRQRSTSLVVLVLCLGSFLLTVAASSELPFLKPLHHVAISEKQGTREHHHWLRMFSRDHMPWSASGSRNGGHEESFHHRIVHEYRPLPTPAISPLMKPSCEMRRSRSGHGMVPGHCFHLRGTPCVHDVPGNGTVSFHFRGNPSTVRSVPASGIVGRPSPGGAHPPPPNPSANVIVEVVEPREDSPPVAV